MEKEISFLVNSLGISRSSLFGLMDINTDEIDNNQKKIVNNFYNYVKLLTDLNYPKEWLLSNILNPFNPEDENTENMRYYLLGHGK